MSATDHQVVSREGGAPRVAWPWHALAAGAILVAAAFLRFWHLSAGIPHALGIDEPQIVERAVLMMKTGDFNPRFFDWPSLTIYVHFVTAAVTFLAGSMRGVWSNLAEVDAANFYLAGRAVTAVVGTATVGLVYLAGRRWSRAHALVAAALLAVVPYHVRESHYVLADVPAAFLTTLTLVLTLRALEQPTLRAFGWAGVAVGLAAGTKYNGLVAGVLPLLAAWLVAGSPLVRLQRTLTVGGAALGAFLLSTPYALLDTPAFLNDYARLAAVFARERAGEPGWSIYLKHLRLALGWPALVAAFAGLAVAGWRAAAGPHRARWWLVVVFPLLYFHVMAGSYQIYGRYLLPLLPFAALLAAIGVMSLAAGLPGVGRPVSARAALVAALVVALLVPPARGAVEFGRRLGWVSTVDQAYAFIEAHVPRDARIVIERRALALPAARSAVDHVHSLVERTFEDYVDDGVDYFLASSEGYGRAFAEPGHPDYDAYATLFMRLDEMAAFEPAERTPGPGLRLFRLPR